MPLAYFIRICFSTLPLLSSEFSCFAFSARALAAFFTWLSITDWGISSFISENFSVYNKETNIKLHASWNFKGSTVVKVATEEGSNPLGSTEVSMATSPESISGLSPSLSGTLESLNNDDGDVNKNGKKKKKKAIGLDWQKNNFEVPNFFVHFFAVIARLQRENA